MDYLREHLIKVVNEIQDNNITISPPSAKLPMRRELPSLGATTFDVRTKNEEDEKEIEEMNVKCKEIRSKLIANGDRDEMKLR